MTTSRGECTPREDIVSTLSGPMVNAVFAASGALMMLIDSAAARDVGLIVVLTNAVCLVENLAPTPGNDAASILESYHEMRNPEVSVSERVISRQARRILVGVWAVALVLVWVSVKDVPSRVVYTVAILGYLAWAWRAWRSRGARLAA